MSASAAMSVNAGIWTPLQVRNADRIAIERHGIPGFVLMSRAAEAAFTAAQFRWPSATRWLVLCGAGNNAGDGYLIASLARTAGLDVSVAALADPARLAGDAGEAYARFVVQGGTAVRFDPALCAGADLIVDAMLGTGLARPVSAPYDAAIAAVNASGVPVLAVDVPTGLDLTCGKPLGESVRADLTVTFVGRKVGLYVGDGPALAGDIVFADLGVPAAAFEDAPALRLFTTTDLAGLLPPRKATAHKGDFGHVLIVGGNEGMAGAVRLAGEAALRAGAGLVTVAARGSSARSLVSVRPELMTVAVESPRDLDAALERATVVALGPGLGSDAWAVSVYAQVIETQLPLVVDADALNLLAKAPRRRDDWILTPHPGEAARLLGSTSREIQADRQASIAELVRRFGGVVVLKGRGTLVAARGETPWLIDRGNPGMATGGMGDVLTGLTAGVLAQTRAVNAQVAAAAAFVHAASGDAAAAEGERGLIASDLFGPMRAWLNPE